MSFWCEKLVQTNSGEAPATQWQGVSSLPHSSFLLWPSAEKLPKHSGRYSGSACLSTDKTILLISASIFLPEQGRQSYCSSSWEADNKGQDFLQSCKLLLQTLGQLSQAMAADCPVLSVLCSRIGLLWANRAGCFTHTQIQIPHRASNLDTCCFVLSWPCVGNALSFFLSLPRKKRFRFCCVFPRSCNPLLISACKMLSSSSKGRCKRRTKYH